MQVQIPVEAANPEQQPHPSAGTFARGGEREVFEAAHPLNLLRQAFADEVASGNP